MSDGVNKYGWDFLKSAHLDGDRGGQAAVATPLVEHLEVDAPPPAIAAAVANKPDLEKQFDVIHFLQAHRSSGYLAPSVIYKATGIDLSEADESVAKMLERNPKIRVELVPDPENPSIMIATYAYQAKYNHVRDRTTLLAQINRCKNGVAMRDLVDAYDGVEKDLAALITAGDVLALRNPEDKDKILFPRGEPFLVELDGIISAKEPPELVGNGETNKEPPKGANLEGNKPPAEGDDVVDAAIERAKMEALRKRKSESCYILETDVDPRKQVRRGEAVCAGGQWFRVSSAVQEGPLSDQPVRAQAPLSVTSLTDLSQRNNVDGYIRQFSKTLLPLDAPLLQSTKANLRDAKEAREKLHKLAGGRGVSGGAAAQLLSSHAHSANPTTLAASFASAAAAGHHGSGAGALRRRLAAQHHKTSHHGPAAAHAAQAHKDVEEAQRAASNPTLTLYAHARRHGCTKDVREMYLATRTKVPKSEPDLYNVMIEHNLLEPGEKMRRPRLAKKPNVDNDGKPKKQRYYVRKNQRRTNVHMDGTIIGAELARATELQRQGKAVGDGGM